MGTKSFLYLHIYNNHTVIIAHISFGNTRIVKHGQHYLGAFLRLTCSENNSGMTAFMQKLFSLLSMVTQAALSKGILSTLCPLKVHTKILHHFLSIMAICPCT